MILSKEQIQVAINNCFTKKPVKRVWLFGSCARGKANEKSDLDVLIDMQDDKKIGLPYLAWHEELEEMINKKVQVVSNAAITDYIRPFIDADKVLIYEK